MKTRYFIRLFILTLFAFSFSPHLHCQPKQEMRGVWVATVANIDWPSQKGLSKQAQQSEAIQLLNHLKKLNFNAVFLQVRPTADAFYKSSHETWSAYLTGEGGKSPGYDPLQFWIEEAHVRGLELHAWINPYRASMDLDSPLPKEHPFSKHPEWFVEYGGKRYFNPAIEDCKIHINQLVKELITNYAVDGVHMDDYFYPYPVQGELFPDTIQYQNDEQSHILSLEDWRRNNVNDIIQSLNQTIKTTKPWVSFGVSPFGVWRNSSDDPRGSNTKAGVTNYDGLYADVLLWMKNGWIDYVVPQLYWETTHTAAPYNTLAHWWNNNAFNTPVYIGHGLYRVGQNEAWNDSTQLSQQLQLNSELENLNGSVYFSYKHLKRDLLGFHDQLKQDFYQQKALPPITALSNDTTSIVFRKIKYSKKGLRWKFHKNSNQEPQKCFVEVYGEGNRLIASQLCYGQAIRWPKTSSTKDYKYILLYPVDGYNHVLQPSRIEL